MKWEETLNTPLGSEFFQNSPLDSNYSIVHGFSRNAKFVVGLKS